MSAPTSSTLSRVVFGLLVLATFTAFFVAQRLKRSEPLVYGVKIGSYISPNGDGRRDTGTVRFRLKKADAVTVDVVDRNDASVRTLAAARHMGKGLHRLRWNGRDESGAVVTHGAYKVRITMRHSGRTFVTHQAFRVDLRPPPLRLTGRFPVTVPAGVHGRTVRLRYSGVPGGARAEFLVFRVRGTAAIPRPVAAFMGAKRVRRGVWNVTVGRYARRVRPCDGKVRIDGRARPAPPGNYVIAVRACDAAGNVGTTPVRLPPRRGHSDKLGGLTVRGIEVAPQMYPTRRRQIVTLPLFSPAALQSYTVRSLDGDVVKRGRAGRTTVSLRLGGTPGGLYIIDVSTRGRDRLTARAPLVVRGSPRAKLLIVEPSIAWQADNPVDLSGDGFPDTFGNLPPSDFLRVAAARPLAGGVLPRGFTTGERAVTRFVTNFGARYDVTTDYAVGLAPTRWLARRHTVVLAGDATWEPPATGIALRNFVERGGSVVMFGEDNLRRTVRIGGGYIREPSARAGRDVFGEATQVVRLAPAPVVPFVDPFGAFTGPVGLFTEFEQSLSLARGAARELAAGRDPRHPAVIAYRLGRGEVIRFGAAGWGAALAAGDPGVVHATNVLLREAAK